MSNRRGVVECVSHKACLVHGCNGTHRAVCYSNRAIALTGVGVGKIIDNADVEILRANTYNELTRWNTHVNYNFAKRSTSAFVDGEIITASKMNNLIADLSNTGHGSTAGVSEGMIISSTKLASDMLSLYNSLRQNCICNTYATTYTACSTCNGTYCNCHTYSDEELKTEITYLKELK